MTATRGCRAALVLGFYAFAVAACGGSDGGRGAVTAPTTPVACGPYPDQTTSAYVLPYEVGTRHRMVHGNCTEAGTSHQAGGTRHHAYDFQMPIGTVIVAARAGRVSAVQQLHVDGMRVPGEENYVMITHDDGTHGRYFHLTQYGSKVAVDQLVEQGEAIALSGDTGESTEPHLHFVVEPAGQSPLVPRGGTPLTFLNTTPHPNGLVQGLAYEAQPYPGCDCNGG